jgi:hypothetical protein
MGVPPFTSDSAAAARPAVADGRQPPNTVLAREATPSAGCQQGRWEAGASRQPPNGGGCSARTRRGRAHNPRRKLNLPTGGGCAADAQRLLAEAPARVHDCCVLSAQASHPSRRSCSMMFPPHHSSICMRAQAQAAALLVATSCGSSAAPPCPAAACASEDTRNYRGAPFPPASHQLPHSAAHVDQPARPSAMCETRPTWHVSDTWPAPLTHDRRCIGPL